ncbi:HNH endonuclease signature motif containing protein [Arthrobacter sp. fls2-241-R2A-200]|uniref:HNH endonuclease n=1 Tax=Arthrobacter sp. fls2-241-R2A-200 TaxID=3040281 RepID=UPI002551AD51|nr:HNH endonuclease signature motif containing protein [Arthrobacter sp. fls2-241-R2A-200]
MSSGQGAPAGSPLGLGCSIGDLISALGALTLASETPALIDELACLEDLKSAIAARQARVAVAFDLAHRREQALAGVPASEQGQDVGAQLALARRESPNRGSRLLGLAKALVSEMPRTMAALEKGLLSEWRATLLVKETACLSVADRCAVDEELAPDTGTFDGAGDRAIASAVKAAAYRRDPRSVTQRASRAAAERRVTLRPAPDTMTYLTALLPAAQGVAAYAALTRHANSVRASGPRSEGDALSQGQLMADTFVERLTGTPGGISSVEVQLVMTDRTLLRGDSEPARLAGYGTVPAKWARVLVGAEGAACAAPDPERAIAGSEPEGDDPGFALYLRRLYTAPSTGELVAMDSKARFFPAMLRRFIEARDNTCRTPYCDAPIRHIDHIFPWHAGGKTTLANGAGLCEACNHSKEGTGWTARPVIPTSSGSIHTFYVTTPTGHHYRSKAPPLPGHYFQKVPSFSEST